MLTEVVLVMNFFPCRGRLVDVDTIRCQNVFKNFREGVWHCNRPLIIDIDMENCQPPTCYVAILILFYITARSSGAN